MALEGREVKVLNVGRRRLEDDLILHVLEEAIGILAVAAVGRTTRGLNITDAVRFGAEHPEKRFRRHGSGANFHIVRLLQHATVAGPEILQTEYEFLIRQRIL